MNTPRKKQAVRPWEPEVADLLRAASDPGAAARELKAAYERGRQLRMAAGKRDADEIAHAVASVNQALARHPNTPPELLTVFVQTQPAALCENPVLPFLTLENPNFWADVPSDNRKKLLRLPQVPAAVVQSLAASGASYADREVQWAARQHVALAGELVPDQWPDAVRAVCREAAACARAEVPQYFADWIETGLLPAEWQEGAPLPFPAPHEEPDFDRTRPTLAQAQAQCASFASDVSPAFLDKLVQGKELRDSPVLLAVALHPNTSAETLRYLGQRREQNLGLAVAQHPNTPPDALRHFAEGGYVGAQERRLFVVRHDRADAETLRLLAQTSDPVARRLARRHKNAPDGLIALSRATANYMGAAPRGGGEMASGLWHIIYALYARPSLEWLRDCAEALSGLRRLSVAVALLRRASDQAAQNPDLPRDRAALLTEPEYVVHLALQRDGSRLVRAVSRAAIPPRFDFSL